MQRIQRLLPFLIAVLMLVPVSVDLVSGKDHTVIRAPTRAYFQESESNNQWSEADVIPVQSGSSMELHGNLSSSSDFDYFYISLTGGAGPVDRISIIPNYVNASDPNDMFLAWFWGFLPDEIDGHNSGDEVSLAVDLWYPDPLWWTSITFHASYTGRYGLIVRPYSTLVGNLKYNLTVTVTPVTPADDHNDIGSAKPLNSGSSLVSGSLTTDQDLFDWYKISAPNPIHPTILDMTFTLGAYSPDYNYGSYDWGAELDMFLMYNSRDTPLTFTSKEYRVASSTRPNFIQNGCSASPLEIDVEKNCTEMYIGVMIRSYGVASNGQRTYSTTRGSASYNLGLDINANIPNKRPVIMDAKVEPT
ncbi:MAG: hypothetical protein U9R75_05795, partial [Candidatus Thermoplasmatota archaeon]|nr:hypothetical protein [Candidatus Thermoplasmatota archaeon]